VIVVVAIYRLCVVELMRVRVRVRCGEQGTSGDDVSKTDADREQLDMHSPQWSIDFAATSSEGV
jgi:hypothetical protein